MHSFHDPPRAVPARPANLPSVRMPLNRRWRLRACRRCYNYGNYAIFSFRRRPPDKSRRLSASKIARVSTRITIKWKPVLLLLPRSITLIASVEYYRCDVAIKLRLAVCFSSLFSCVSRTEKLADPTPFLRSRRDPGGKENRKIKRAEAIAEFFSPARNANNIAAKFRREQSRHRWATVKTRLRLRMGERTMEGRNTNERGEKRRYENRGKTSSSARLSDLFPAAGRPNRMSQCEFRPTNFLAARGQDAAKKRIEALSTGGRARNSRGLLIAKNARPSFSRSTGVTPLSLSSSSLGCVRSLPCFPSLPSPPR